MNFDFDLPINVVKWLAVVCRLGAFLLPCPIFISRHVPNKVKIIFIVVLAFVLLPFIPNSFFNTGWLQHLNLLSLLVFILSEMVIGLLVAIIFLISMEIFSFGGFGIDQALGLVMAQEVDPTTNVNSSLFATLLSQMFIVVFLIFNGHHELIRIATASFRTLPPGSFYINGPLIEALSSLSARIFLTGVQIALPIMAVNFMLNVGMGLIARVGEDFPVLMLSFPIRLGLGFLMMMAVIPVLLIFCREVNDLISTWMLGITGIQ